MRARHIGVLVETSRAYGRGVAEGIIGYAREHDWVLFPQESGLFLELPPWLLRERLDGIIAFVFTQAIGRRLLAKKIPAVDVYGQGFLPGAPIVGVDADAVAIMAADFFLKAGFTRFAFCGYPGIFFSDRRQEAFARRLAREGIAPKCYAPPAAIRRCMNLYLRERGGMEYEKDIAAWLKKLPKPIAILACNDIRGQQILNACRNHGIQSPEEVAVLGTDNDALICEMSHPTLSSIVPDTAEIGRLAAGTLDVLMEGRKHPGRIPKPELFLVPPLRIVERQSTESVPDSHPVIAAATRFIRDGACEGVTVEGVCEATGFGRTHLDTLFKERLGRTVSREILRIRLNRSRRLLLETDLPLALVAKRAGFLTLPHFCRVFKREHRLSPSLFRREAHLS